MIITADCETKGLDAREFTMGCLYFGKDKAEYFYKKEDMWKRILELGIQEMKKKRVLTIYCHNCQYDFYCFANLYDTNIKYYTLRPFIAKYEIKGKTAIKFLDSLGIFKMSLKELGDVIGKPKLGTPEHFLKGLRQPILTELDKDYIKRDCEIVYDSIYMLKDKLEREGVRLKGIYTTSQIAINYFMNKLREDKENDDLFQNEKRIRLCKTKCKPHIHKAYRGGRVECFKTGKFRDVNYIDANNLYGYASMNIRFPDLKTEKFLYNPLRNGNLKELLNEIGISKAMVYNKKNKLGLLPIRTNLGSYYPKKGKTLIGVWTNMELKEAIKEGYEIKRIEWSITWKEHKNPYKEITKRLYELRLQNKNKFEKLFYKEMQNRSYGKLAQHRPKWELVIDSVELAEKYIAENWKAVKGVGKSNYIYEKEVRDRLRNYYCPIIPTLINAWARIYMYRCMNQFSYEDLMYHDTDSIMYLGDLPEGIKISKDIGMFKVVNHQSKAIIYGRKTYAIGKEIKISGFRKSKMDIRAFERGNIENLRMETIKTTKDFNKVGGFKKERRNLKNDNLKYLESRGILEAQKVYIDADTKNINFFIDLLKGI